MGDIIKIGASLLTALIVCFAAAPPVGIFAKKVGAMDVPTDGRRMHDHPIPRHGGLAIFLGFLVAVLLFSDLDRQVWGIILGSVIIVALGALDDIVSLSPMVKLAGQTVAAVVAVAFGVRIEFIANPIFWSDTPFISFQALSIPITVCWIVVITNSINLIDGLDGLACGVSAISSLSILVISLIMGNVETAILLAAVLGACVGFMPYNINPAKMFMGDAGALLLGYILSTVSVIGLLKFDAVISFTVPLLALALPLFDTCFAIVRRVSKGRSPMSADRGHLHHRLIDIGLTQKQSVAVLYAVSAVMGLAAVLMTVIGELKILVLALAICAVISVGVVLLKKHSGAGKADARKSGEADDNPNKDGEE